MPLTLHAEVRGSNPLGSTDKLPANDEEIENSSRHAEDAVQQPCHNPSESFELLDKLIARKMPICGKPIPCGDFLAWEHLVAPRDGLCFLLSLALRGNLPLFFRRRPGILQRCGLLRRRSRPVQDLLETSEHHLVEVLGCQDVDVVAKGFLLR